MSLHDPPRHRQSHAQAAARADHLYDDPAPAPQPQDPYLGNGYHAPGAAYRSRSPEGGTLTALLSNVARTAQQTFSSSSSSNGAMPFSNLNGHGGGGGGGNSGSNGALSNFLPKLAPSARDGSSAGPASLAAYLPSTSTAGFIFLCCLWYLSSAFSSNTGKSILTRFRYPVTLTFVQFAFVAGYCVVVLFLRERLGRGGATGHASGGLSRRRMSVSTMGGWGIRKPSRHMFHGTFMMSLFQIAGHVFSSMAIARVPVSTVHTIKALSPLFTVLSYAALFGVRYSSATYVALLPLTVGVMLACSFDLRANAVGFLCALGSTFIFVAQNIFSKKLLPKENTGAISAEEKAGPSSSSSGSGSSGGGTGAAGSAKLDKLNLLLYSSGMAFFLMIPIWLYSDASALFFAPVKAIPSHASAIVDDSPTRTLVFYFFANGTVHFAQNLLAFSLLARTSPVTYSIASLVKRIAVICIAIVWSGQHVSLVQAVGMTSTFGGLWMYNRAKSDVDKGEKRRTQVEKRHDMSLPTTVGDVRDLDGGVTPPPPSSLPSGAYAGGPTSPRAPAPPHAHPHSQAYGADPSSSHHLGASSVYASPASAPSGGGGGYGSHAHNSPYAPPPPHHSSASASAHTSPGGAAGRPHKGGLANGFSSSAAGGSSGAPSSSSIIGGPSMARNRTASASREPPRDRSAVAAMEQWEKAHAGGAHTVPASLFSSPVSVGGGGGEGGYR